MAHRDGAQPLHQPPQDLLDPAPATLLALHLTQRVEMSFSPVDGFSHATLTNGFVNECNGRNPPGLSLAGAQGQLPGLPSREPLQGGQSAGEPTISTRYFNKLQVRGSGW